MSVDKTVEALLSAGKTAEEIRERDLLLDRALLYEVVAPHLLGFLLDEPIDLSLGIDDVRRDFVLLAFRVGELDLGELSSAMMACGFGHMKTSLEQAGRKNFGYLLEITDQDIEFIAPKAYVLDVARNVKRSELRSDYALDTDKIFLNYADGPLGYQGDQLDLVA